MTDTEIKDGKVKGDEITFNVVREFNNNKMTSKYTGKVTTDTIKGKIETERNGQTNSRDWTAKREPVQPAGKVGKMNPRVAEKIAKARGQKGVRQAEVRSNDPAANGTVGGEGW